MRKIINLGVFAIIVFMFSSCAKDGAVGPAGAKGADGTQGPAGIPGVKGTTGNANVQNFDITVTTVQWVYDNLYERHYYRFPSSANSQSAVYGYVMDGSGKQAMPYHNSTTAWSRQFDFATNLFRTPPYIEFQFTNLISKTTAPTSDVNFYLVIIPPALANARIDYQNYEEVQKAFDLGEPIKINVSK